MRTVQILESQTQTKISPEMPILKIKKGSKVGRPQSLSIEDLLNAIRLYATTSETELAKKLNVSRQTIYRKMRLIPKETIAQIMRDLSQTELKPYQLGYDGFLTIPEVQQFKTALERRQVSKQYRNEQLRAMWRLCVYLQKHPSKLTIEQCADILTTLKQKKIPNLNLYHIKIAIRSWFQNVRGLNGEILTAKGIDASMPYHMGIRAFDRLTRKQRHDFIKALKQIIPKDSYSDAWISLPYFLYYTGTRIKASLKAKIEDIEKHGNYWIIKVIDKGKHKNGRKLWRKLIIGELKEKLEKNIASRGNIKNGLLFPFSYETVRLTFITAYKEANIPMPKQPCHIWRHTSAQDFLEATDWNYELSAQVLGWEDPRILRKCYGSISEPQKYNAIRKAMGQPIKETKKEFRF
jgi:integrase